MGRARVRRAAVGMLGASLLGALACGDDADGGTETAAETEADSEAAEAPSLRRALAAHRWALDGTAGEPTIDVGRAVSIAFEDDDAVRGTGPCNTYRGSFTVGGDSIEISEISSTRMSCEDETMAAEHAYFEALASVTGAEVDDDGAGGARLALTGEGGVRLAFDSYDPGELLVGEWHVVGLARGDAVESVLEGTDPVLTFAADGDVSLATGCNTIATTWRLDGDALELGTPRQTLMECADPPGVMEQEAALGAALEAATRVEVAPGTLSLLDADGSIVLVANAPPAGG